MLAETSTEDLQNRPVKAEPHSHTFSGSPTHVWVGERSVNNRSRLARHTDLENICASRLSGPASYRTERNPILTKGG